MVDWCLKPLESTPGGMVAVRLLLLFSDKLVLEPGEGLGEAVVGGADQAPGRGDAGAHPGGMDGLQPMPVGIPGERLSAPLVSSLNLIGNGADLSITASFKDNSSSRVPNNYSCRF